MKRASHFHTVTLEISLKPFRRTDEAFVREVCAGVFEQWRPLLKARETISILIFAADGSEILDYSGDLDAPFEWCKYLGTANCPSQGQDDPPWRSLHERRVLYCEDPPVMTYRVLKRVVAAFPSSRAWRSASGSPSRTSSSECAETTHRPMPGSRRGAALRTPCTICAALASALWDTSWRRCTTCTWIRRPSRELSDATSPSASPMRF